MDAAPLVEWFVSRVFSNPCDFKTDEVVRDLGVGAGWKGAVCPV